jgi:hypothetical protein
MTAGACADEEPPSCLCVARDDRWRSAAGRIESIHLEAMQKFSHVRDFTLLERKGNHGRAGYALQDDFSDLLAPLVVQHTLRAKQAGSAFAAADVCAVTKGTTVGGVDPAPTRNRRRVH